jgi:hypothetical protein
MNFPDRVPGIPDFTPIFDLIREERILSAILGHSFADYKTDKSDEFLQDFFWLRPIRRKLSVSVNENHGGGNMLIYLLDFGSLGSPKKHCQAFRFCGFPVKLI